MTMPIVSRHADWHFETALPNRSEPPFNNARMNPVLNIKLLGQPVFLLDGVELPCVSKKALWLAAYVLLGNTVQPRARLAALFWGGSNGSHSLGSLRVALTKLPPPVLACLDVQRDRIGIAADAHYRLDVDEFLADCDAPDIDRLQSAVVHYEGDFFDGVDAAEAPEFSDWLFGERNRLRQLAHDAHVSLAQAWRAQGQRDAARSVADTWLKRQPADEAMHRLLMTWLAEDSGNDRALAQFDVYRRALAVTQGAAPSPAMLALAERLRERHTGSMELPARLAPATSFFGRDADLAALRQSLDDPGCRLLTLHGMGGVGKTRLALAVAEAELTRFGDGVFVAALDDVVSPALFAQTVARACGLQPAGATAPLDLLIAFFRRRNALLVLDNLEHLLGDSASGLDDDLAAQVARLLAGTSGRFKVLTTSRQPLRLQEEWIHDISGLAYPQTGGESDLQNFAAVRLFSQRARQVHAAFSLSANTDDVVRICNLLEGLPLGLELAASWVGTLPVSELVTELGTRAAAIDNRHRNRVERHRSLGAVVAFSWERLTDELRQALSGLAVLVGTFSSEAAGEIASASPAALQALADKALLTQTADGRWHLHEVVRQFAWEQSGKAPALRDTVRNRRDAYCMGWLRDIGKRLEGPEELKAVAEIDSESANLREAWQSCARNGNVAALEAAAPAWFDYLECRSFIAEGIAAAELWQKAAGKKAGIATYYLGLFQRFGARTADALTTLDKAIALLPKAAKPSRTLVQVRSAKAFTFLLLGRLADAESEAAGVLAQAEQLGDPSLLASACRVLGLAMLQSGRREECRTLQLRALSLAIAAGRPSLLAAAHNNLALAENHLGNYAAAEAGYQSALAGWREMQATANIGRGMHNLGVVSRRRGDNDTALTRYQAALEVLRKAGDRNLIALNLMSTGDVLLRLGRPAEAREPALQALEMAEHDGHLLPAMDARIVLAQAATELGDVAEAARHLLIALDAAEKHQFINVLADAVLSTARLAVAAKPATRLDALSWVCEIAASDRVSTSIRSDAVKFVELHDELTPVQPVQAPRGLPALAAEARAALRDLNGPGDPNDPNESAQPARPA
ncbi:MAG: tetratricopeptide repeat protein [Betaproteobacteria bacterium]|nr:tetratricopeptide repeat protein [Betaproteobacteria bacterium]